MRRIVTVSLVAWFAGFVAHIIWLRLVWGQGLGGDWQAVVAWSLVAFAIAAALAYVPAMLVLRKLLRGYKPLFLFPLVGALVGVVPVALIVRIQAGDFSQLATPEASLYFVMFGVVGIVFGLGFALFRHDG